MTTKRAKKPGIATSVARARKPTIGTVAKGERSNRSKSLRGLLPTPPEVAELVARELEGHPVTDREKQRLTDGFNLQYHFGGEYVAYRRTEEGAYVLAIGLHDVGKLLRKKMTQAERESIIVRWMDPW